MKNFENAPKIKMSNSTRKNLLKYYTPFNKELEFFLDRKLEIWKI